MAEKEAATPKLASFADLDRAITKIQGAAPDPRIRYWLSTGVTLLDMAICAGLPGGRITEIYGNSAGGKTLLALSIARQAIRRGGNVFWQDAEARFSVSLASELVRTNISDRFRYAIPDSLEDALKSFNVWGTMAANNPHPQVLVLDSLAALEQEDSNIENDPTSAKEGKMRVAAIMSQWLRKGLIRRIAGSNVHIIIINQVRDDVQFGWTGGYKKPEPKPAGGRALAFYASTRISVFQSSIQKTDKDVGTMIGFQIKKNSVGPPNRIVQIPFYFKGNMQGLRDDISLINFLITKGVVKKKKEKNKIVPGVFTFEGEDLRKVEIIRRMHKDEGFQKRILSLIKSNF